MPLDASTARQHTQPLTGTLAQLSFECASCEGPTRLHLQFESGDAYAVLSDRVLSVLKIDEQAGHQQAIVTQVQVVCTCLCVAYTCTRSCSLSDCQLAEFHSLL